MKLLIVTQSVDRDDENLGAFYYWFEQFAKKADKVVIIASRVGKTNFPDHVIVESLGKERGVGLNASRRPSVKGGLGRINRLRKFFALFAKHYAETDAVFFHQIPEFVIAASPFLMSLRRRKVLWYAHKSVTLRLRIAEKLVDFVATSNEAGFRLPSKKVIYVGQAINTDLFKPGFRDILESFASGLRLVTVGRISPIKNYEALINACEAGKDLWPQPWSLTIVGGPLLPGDYEYLEALKRLIAAKNLTNHIRFHGSVPYAEVPRLLGEHDIFINVSSTGSLDKAVFEAMACGLTVLTSNEAYREILPSQYFLEYTNAEFIAERVKALASEKRPNRGLRQIVLDHHSLAGTVDKVAALLTS